jgi:hypothetical protein
MRFVDPRLRFSLAFLSRTCPARYRASKANYAHYASLIFPRRYYYASLNPSVCDARRDLRLTTPSFAAALNCSVGAACARLIFVRHGRAWSAEGFLALKLAALYQISLCSSKSPCIADPVGPPSLYSALRFAATCVATISCRFV